PACQAAPGYRGCRRPGAVAVVSSPAECRSPPDNLDIRIGFRLIETEALANRVLVREEFPRHALTDHYNFWSRLRIGCQEFSPQHQSDSDRLKKSRSDRIAIDMVVSIGSRD